jgi:hypothetical protein
MKSLRVRQHIGKSFGLAILALGFMAGGMATLHAQDQRDQTEQRDQGKRDQGPQRNKDAPRDAAPASDRGDQTDQYRRAHPSAAARCHDGFFTRTKDRKTACSKHGGIDTWLLP